MLQTYPPADHWPGQASAFPPTLWSRTVPSPSLCWAGMGLAWWVQLQRLNRYWINRIIKYKNYIQVSSAYCFCLKSVMMKNANVPEILILGELCLKSIMWVRPDADIPYYYSKPSAIDQIIYTEDPWTTAQYSKDMLNLRVFHLVSSCNSKVNNCIYLDQAFLFYSVWNP